MVKSWGGIPNFRVEDPLIYIKELNWVNNWIDKYFFTKVSDFLFAVFVTMLLVLLIFKESIDFKFQNNVNKNLIFYLLIFLSFIFWFLKFPSFKIRWIYIVNISYNNSFCFLFDFQKISYKRITKNFIILFSISILIFISRNILRIEKELNYSAVENFKSFPFFYVKKTNYEEEIINDEKILKL